MPSESVPNLSSRLKTGVGNYYELVFERQVSDGFSNITFKIKIFFRYQLFVKRDKSGKIRTFKAVPDEFLYMPEHFGCGRRPFMIVPYIFKVIVDRPHQFFRSI